MASPPKSLPAPVLDALRHGDTAEAVRLMRASGGMGLMNAKAIVDSHLGRSIPFKPATPASKPLTGPVFSSGLPTSVVEALQRGEKIQAIRLMREITGVGLKEAKDAVDASPHTATRGGLSPGEVPRTGRAVWTALAVMLVAWLVYLAMRSAG